MPYLFTRFFLVFMMIVSASFGVHGQSGIPRSLKARDYLLWYQSASYPFRDTVLSGGLVYVCEYVPYEVEVSRSVLSDHLDSRGVKKLLKNRPEDFHFRLFLLLPVSGIDIFNYQLQQSETRTSRVEYFSFTMRSDLKLVTFSGDSLHCGSMVLERGLSGFPRSVFDLYFSSGKNARPSYFIFEDKIFSKTQLVFDMRTLTTRRTPKLII